MAERRSLKCLCRGRQFHLSLRSVEDFALLTSFSNGAFKSNPDIFWSNCARYEANGLRNFMLLLSKTKLGQSWPLFLFIFVLSSCHDSNLNWKNYRWCTWDSNPGRQNDVHWWIHWAMAAPLFNIFLWVMHLQALALHCTLNTNYFVREINGKLQCTSDPLFDCFGCCSSYIN